MRNARQRITDLVADQFGVTTDTVSESTHLVNDLGADELELLDLEMALENEFGTAINDESFSRCSTVGSLVTLISNVLS